MPQNNAAATTALYDGSLHNVGPGQSNTGDAVMARWLQSAGLQHLASPLASTGIDQRFLPNLLMQGYGAQSAEEKQRLFKLTRNLNFNGESGSETYIPATPSFTGMGVSDGFYSPKFKGNFGAGLLDLHAMDDTELLSEHVMDEPSPFMAAGPKAFENDFGLINDMQRGKQTDADASAVLSTNERETSAQENNVAKIKVVVRKRPLNKKELSRKEDDIVTVFDNACLTVLEPKLKVDLTAYVEKHEFCFDAVLNEHVTNDEFRFCHLKNNRCIVNDNSYNISANEGYVFCLWADRLCSSNWNHNGCSRLHDDSSGKTYTMQPLPLRAVEDMVRWLHQPVYRNQRLKLWLSYFEIYGGKRFDLLCERKKLCMREDGRQQVCIVGLQEFEVFDVQVVREFIERGNAARSTGLTGANEESSRSHAILQLAVKKHNEIKESRRNNSDGNEAKSGKLVGKISFIDLAGSERGADPTDNDRRTRIEGALWTVIKFIFPLGGHTLNTLRYADRVKSLSKGGNARKDQLPSLTTGNKESSSAYLSTNPVDVEDVYEPIPYVKGPDMGRKLWWKRRKWGCWCLFNNG
ncbi:hypothetical protein MLD38_038852 [Melastoma candidum]|uniref:Uncharacterized protein n=1 Tax=Melastoma candidum TaxID=119954 RepID=A0ACB9L080_9MYRT|nr:hypothetical protein MLD38_038852 [Melastoma candidum]